MRFGITAVHGRRKTGAGRAGERHAMNGPGAMTGGEPSAPARRSGLRAGEESGLGLRVDEVVDEREGDEDEREDDEDAREEDGDESEDADDEADEVDVLHLLGRAELHALGTVTDDGPAARGEVLVVLLKRGVGLLFVGEGDVLLDERRDRSPHADLGPQHLGLGGIDVLHGDPLGVEEVGRDLKMYKEQSLKANHNNDNGGKIGYIVVIKCTKSKV